MEGGRGQIFMNSFARLACVYKAQWLKDIILCVIWLGTTKFKYKVIPVYHSADLSFFWWSTLINLDNSSRVTKYFVK